MSSPGPPWSEGSRTIAPVAPPLNPAQVKCLHFLHSYTRSELLQTLCSAYSNKQLKDFAPLIEGIAQWQTAAKLTNSRKRTYGHKKFLTLPNLMPLQKFFTSRNYTSPVCSAVQAWRNVSIEFTHGKYRKKSLLNAFIWHFWCSCPNYVIDHFHGMSNSFNPILSRTWCWTAIQLSRNRETSGHALHGESMESASVSQTCLVYVSCRREM